MITCCAKGGVVCNPKEYSFTELERICRAYVRAFYKNLGPNVDVPAPDVNTTEQMMAWMTEEYSTLVGEQTPGSFTGKPIGQGGSQGRAAATAKGGMFVLEEFLRQEFRSDSQNIAIQGFGNAGATFARLVEDRGWKVVAVSDTKGAVYRKEGLAISRLEQHKAQTGSVANFPDAETINPEDVLTLDVDVLVPAALGGVITSANADMVKAAYILELANGPVTVDAQSILKTKGIRVIPDVLANAGGVTVSYFEWVQNESGQYWSEEEVINKLQDKMITAAKVVFAESTASRISYRDAAYSVALKKLAESYPR